MSQSQRLDGALSAGGFDCALCLKLLYDPVTASCGHSYCRRCAFELVHVCSSFSATDHNAGVGASTPTSLRCPMCRASLDRRWVPSPSIALGRLLRLSYPAEYQAREAEDLALNRSLPLLPHGPVDINGRKILPLFVLDCILPGQRMLLHVFEIRYRLLVQRALAEHNRRFGMVGACVPSSSSPLVDESPRSTDTVGNTYGTSASPPSSTASVSRSGDIVGVGTEVEIVSCNELPDGRFRVVIEGRSIFRIVDRRLVDGYWEGSVEKAHIDDMPHGDTPTRNSSRISRNGDGDEAEEEYGLESENEPDRADAENDSATALCLDIIRRYQEWEGLVRSNAWERYPNHMEEVRNIVGPIPEPDKQPGQLSIWLAAVINPLPPLGVSKEIRLAVLSATNTMHRLRIVSDALDESLAIVRKRRGTVEVLGVDVNLQIILFGLFGLILGFLGWYTNTGTH